MFVIQKGTVAVRKMKGGAYIDLARVHQNEVVGELSFFDRQPRSAAAIALTECEALEIDFNSLDKIYSGMPPYFKTILSCVAERLRKANDVVRRLQKHLVEEDDGVIGRAPKDEDAEADLAMLNAVSSGEALEGEGKAKEEDAEDDEELEKEFNDLEKDE